MNIRPMVRPMLRTMVRSMVRGSGFDPLTLFANGEEGAWYDPSDLTTLYQDSAGTTPVATDGDPVGLMLDKSRGLARGVELVLNGTFDTDVSGWSPNKGGESITWSDGKAVVSFTSIGDAGIKQVFSHPGGRCEVTATVTRNFTGASAIKATTSDGSTADVPISDGETKTITFIDNRASSGLSTVLVRTAVGVGSGSFTVDDISVRQVLGNHASQSSSGLKPIYRTDGTLHWLEFDGFDDWLAIPIAFMGSASDSNTTIAASKSTGGGIYLLGCTSDQGIMMLNGPTGYRGTAYTSALHQAGSSTGLFASGTTVVASSKFDRAAGSVDIQLSTGYSDVTTFTPGDKLIPASSALGIRGTQVINMFQGSFYGIITNNTAMSEADRDSAEAYLATKSGVTL